MKTTMRRRAVRLALPVAAAAATVAVSAVPVWAAESGGLPQLTQTDTFVGQIFWTVVTFGLLYLVMAKIVIPRIGEAMEERQDKIDDDLSRAEKLKSESEQVLEEYEAALAKARAEARETHRIALEAWEAEAAKREAAFAETQSAQIREAEQRIGAAKQEAMANLKTVATEVATAAAAKLLGQTPAEAEARAAVEATMGGSGANEGGRG